MADLSELEAVLGYTFEDRDILLQALTHSSFASEHPGTVFNERFEFLGDAVLGLAVTEFLFDTYPDLAEGELSKIRASSVSGLELSEIARSIGLGAYLRLDRGEEATGGRDKPSILEDAMEALIGAIHLDGGYSEARTVILSLWEHRLRAKATTPGKRDYKSRLQELLAPQQRRPQYRVDGSGPDHARMFEAVVEVDGEEWGRGSGKSKKEAEQEAARQALSRNL